METANTMTSLVSGASTSGSSGGSSVAGPFFSPPSPSFSTFSFLPPARRCFNGGSSISNNNKNNNNQLTPGFTAIQQSVPNIQQQRKRPGCHHCCIHQSLEDQPEDVDEQLDCQQPLDLSLPKFKVRQHWSGGSIVHESAAVHCQFSPVVSHSGSTTINSFNVSVTVQPTTTTTQRWQMHHHHHDQRHYPSENWLLPPAEQLRLRIDIPHNNSETTSSRIRRSTHRKSFVSSSERGGMNQSGTVVPADDDYQKLSITENQLRLSGFYYRNLSWKESIQLLQNTPVGTFLVRDSSDSRFLYALSLQTDRGPTSVRIHYSSRGFRLDAAAGQTGLVENLPRFRTVLNLVDHYVAKWSKCREKGQFWLDNNGQVHSEVVLIRPLIRECPSLQHFCRLSWNNRTRSIPVPAIPPAIKSYLADYPFQH